MTDTLVVKGGDSLDPDAPGGWEVGWAQCSACGHVWTPIAPFAVVHDFLCPACRQDGNDYMSDMRRQELGLPDPKT